MSSRTALTFHLRGHVTPAPACCSASLRRQSGHRQSLPSDRHRQPEGFVAAPARPRQAATEFSAASGAGEAARGLIFQTDLSSTGPHPDAELIRVHAEARYIRANHIRPGNSEGNPMARDLQAALVALNRFGFGARGGASGDFLNAASDPRGFVKAELGRPNGVLLEVPGLQSTPALGKAVFDYQFEIQQARDAAAKSARRRHRGRNRSRMRRRSGETFRSTASRWIWRRKSHRRNSRRSRRKIANAAMAPAETMQPNAPKPPPQPLNIIQKTFRAEALARLQRGDRSPIAGSPSGWWCSGPIISASPPTRAGWRGCGPARSSARRSGHMCSGVSATC